MAIDALPPPEEKRAAVKAMFDRIAPRYDALNRIMTLGLDQRWRSRALDAAEVGADDILVDLACGTGDLAEQAAARGAQVIGVDFAREMLRGAQRRLEGVSLAQGDGAALPFATGSATVLTCGFALRNFVELGQVFREMGRVLTPGGRLVLIEVDRPPSGVVRAGHSLYFDRVVPKVGGWLSDRAAYAYLPQSTSYLPGDDDLREMLELAGFSEITKQRLLLGTAQILIGVRS
ncbi:MAG: ubiquinone/menaquinone biosynthesis methyltransferase [Myxococcota bacterium]